MKTEPMRAREATETESPARSSIDIRGLVIQAGSNRLLDLPSLRISAGCLTAVVGPNGAGKSTLMSVLAGLRQPTLGQVCSGGHRIDSRNTEELARERAYLPQEHPVAFDFTARQVVELGRYAHRHSAGLNERAIVEAALHETGVLHLAQRIYNSLSGGEKARVQLARALAQVWPVPLQSEERNHRWLLLDEPTASLDVRHSHHVLQAVRRWVAAQPGAGAMAVLHDLNLALWHADEVCVLADGRCVASGPTREVLTESLVTRVWHVSCEAIQTREGHPQLLLTPPAV